jgi:leucyl/phenylalanyl-tRNA--protein transferase
MDVVRISRGLDAEGVLEAYRQGIFPMGYSGRGLITWHRPRMRAILPLDAMHIPRSLRRLLRKAAYEVTFDREFDTVIAGCADRDSTWITASIRRVYNQLYNMGHAHSVEIRVDGKLAAGLYGVHIGGAFFAESKFHHVRDMSKVALVHLVRQLSARGFSLLEVQYLTAYLEQFGVIEIPHERYMQMLAEALARECGFA